ncbi:MAG: hypothetical protein JW987_08925 [Anaerolineaceae bacterium]|nr:hypothetical protein [Anaerolineaceae bacterium]
MTPIVFKPRPSSGWLTLGGIGFVLLVYSVAILASSISANTGLGFLWPILLMVGIGAVFIFIAAWFPTMRYVLYDDTLELIYGPLLRYKIPLAEIRGMRRRDLRMSLLSSMRLPGLALFEVTYGDVGKVKMCSTAALKGILLIETEHGLYGITPADEEGLVAAVRARTGK